MTATDGDPAAPDLLAVVQHDVPALLRALRGTAVEEVRLERGQNRIVLRRSFDTSPLPAGAALSPGGAVGDDPAIVPGHQEVKAHMVGVFHRAREQDGTVLATEGGQVRQGQPLGIIETLGIPSEVEAPAAGRLVSVIAEDGQPVEYAQVIAVIATG